MKMLKTTVALIAVIVSLTVVRTDSSQMDPFPIQVMIEPVPVPIAAGPVNLQVKIVFKEGCESAKLAVSGVDNLQYSGDTVWNLTSNPKDTTVLNLHMVIPDRDTSGIGFTCYFSERGKFQKLAYFVADSKKVTFHNGNPRQVRQTPTKMIDMSDPPMTEEMRQGKSSVGYYDEEKNWVPEDSVKNGLSPTGKRVGFFNEAGVFISLDSLHKLVSQSTFDSTTTVMKEGDRTKTWMVNKDGSRIQVDRQWLLDYVKQAKIEKEYDNMHLLEQTPLTQVNMQDIAVDGNTYRRLRGEYKFHLIESTTDRQGSAERYKDSLNIQKGKVFEYNFDLRDPSHLEYAKSKIDDLAQSDSAGYYRATIDWQTVLDLRKKGIIFHKIGWRPKGQVAPNHGESTEKKN